MAISVYLCRAHRVEASYPYYEQRENGLGSAFLDEIDARLTESFSSPPLGIRYRREQDAVELIVFHSV